MTLIEHDLLADLKELREVSGTMTSGVLTSADTMERYQQALAWADRAISMVERG